MRRRLRTSGAQALLALLALLALAGCAQATTATTATSGAPQTQLTIAKDGGLRVMLQVVCATGQSCSFSNAAQGEVSALQSRARVGLGVPSATVTQLDASHIQVDLPGYTNQQLGAEALGAQGMVRFIDTSGMPLDVGAVVGENQYPTLFTNSQIDPASVGAHLDQQSQPVVVFAFKGAAAAQFAQYTGSHIGDYLTVTLDNTVIESATIQSQISGQGQVNGFKTLADAQTLAADLKSTPLPLPVTVVSAQTLSPGSK